MSIQLGAPMRSKLGGFVRSPLGVRGFNVVRLGDVFLSGSFSRFNGDTFTVNATTNVLTVSDSLLLQVLGEEWPVRLRNEDGALPAPLAPATTYYLRDISGADFKLSASPGGAAIDLTDTGSGVHLIGTDLVTADNIGVEADSNARYDIVSGEWLPADGGDLGGELRWLYAVARRNLYSAAIFLGSVTQVGRWNVNTAEWENLTGFGGPNIEINWIMGIGGVIHAFGRQNSLDQSRIVYWQEELVDPALYGEINSWAIFEPEPPGFAVHCAAINADGELLVGCEDADGKAFMARLTDGDWISSGLTATGSTDGFVALAVHDGYAWGGTGAGDLPLYKWDMEEGTALIAVNPADTGIGGFVDISGARGTPFTRLLEHGGKLYVAGTGNWRVVRSPAHKGEWPDGVGTVTFSGSLNAHEDSIYTVTVDAVDASLQYDDTVYLSSGAFFTALLALLNSTHTGYTWTYPSAGVFSRTLRGVSNAHIEPVEATLSSTDVTDVTDFTTQIDYSTSLVAIGDDTDFADTDTLEGGAAPSWFTDHGAQILAMPRPLPGGYLSLWDPASRTWSLYHDALAASSFSGGIHAGTLGHIPAIEITEPETFEFDVAEPITFTAIATDEDDGDISASIVWYSDQDGEIGTGESIEVSTLSEAVHTIIAVAHDADGNPVSTTTGVQVGDAQEPTVEITEPADGAEFTDEDEITFSATATDIQDGDISANIEWTSDIDGSLGTGASIAVSLTVGEHEITAYVEDSDSNPGQASIIVTVTA